MSRRKCPTPTKQRHRNRDAAEAAIRNFRRTAEDLLSPDLLPYKCECGAWHVGHSKRALDQRIRQALRRKERA
jgi:hypothetical protein